MQITFIVSRCFTNTQEFIRTVARSPGISVAILKGDEPPDRAVRVLRFSHRVWFEGAGPLLAALVDRSRTWKLPKAYLRVAPEQVAGLPWPDLWNVVSDLVVSSQAAAQAAAAATGPDRAPGLIHVLEDDLRRQIFGEVSPQEQIGRLGELLLKLPGGPTRDTWESIAVLGETCRGRVLVRGAAPRELIDHLARGCGLEVLTAAPADGRPADSVVFWKNLAARSGAAGPAPGPSDAELAEGLAHLRPGGIVAAVAPAHPKSHTRSAAAIKGLLEQTLGQRARGRVAVRGRVAIVEGDPAPAAPAAVSRDAAPLVSAVVFVYNDAARIDRSLWSLRGQTYPNLEILVVDDGSTDGTAEAVAKHLNDPRVRYLYKPHSGRPESRNFGIRHARGDYIAWLGSDDEALPNRIQLQADAVRKDPGIGIVHADGFFVRPDSTLQECRRYKPLAAETLPRMLLDGFATVCPILDTTAMIRRDLFDRIGYYDPAFLRCQDYEFYIRAAMAGNVKFHHIAEPLVKVYMSPPSPQRLRMSLDYYLTLARRIIDFFGPDRLMDDVARDLQESPCLVLARSLAGVAIVFKAPPDHAICHETRGYLKRAIETASLQDRAEAWKIMAVLAQSNGDRDMAALYLTRAKESAVAAFQVPGAAAAESARSMATWTAACPA